MKTYNPYERMNVFLNMIKEKGLIYRDEEFLLCAIDFIELPLNNDEFCGLLNEISRKGVLKFSYKQDTRNNATSLETDIKFYNVALVKVSLRKLDKYIESLEKNNMVTPDYKAPCSLVKRGQSIFILTPTEEILITHLKPDMAPDQIFSYLFTMRLNSVVTIQELQGAMPFLTTIQNLSDIVRKVGFTKELKKYFFPICTREKIKLNNEVEVPVSLIRRIKRKTTEQTA